MLTDSDTSFAERLPQGYIIAPRLAPLPGSAPTQAQLDEIIDRACAALDEARKLLSGRDITISLNVHDVPQSVFDAFPQAEHVIGSGGRYKDIGTRGRLGIFLSFDERPRA